MSFSALLLSLALASTSAADAAAVNREQVGNRLTENVPAVSAELVERLNRYQNTRGASFAGWLENGDMLITTRFAETNQAHRVSQPLGMREQLTFYSEPINAVMPAPRKGSNGFVFGKDVGGSEFWQLFWYDIDTRQVTLLTDGKRSQNTGPLWSHDGTQLAWSSTARNGTDYDIWIRDMATGQSRQVLDKGGMWRVADFSPDGKRLLVINFVSINESYPGELDLATGTLNMFPVTGGKAAFNALRYAPDGHNVYVISDENRQFLTLRLYTPSTAQSSLISGDIPWDIEQLVIANNGKHLAFVSNEDGISRLRVLTLPEHRELTLPALPIGVIGSLDFTPEGDRLALTLNSATSPSDVQVIDLAKQSLTPWTRSEVGGLDTRNFRAPSLVRYPSFDKVDGKPRTIPAFYYQPAGDGPFPVVISIHGGPEAQAFPTFNPSIQFLLEELKVAVLVPNVRGSAGYGKDYLQLDNGFLREDSVRDIGALLDWIATRPELDANRVGVSGGSYGGYMVLASMSHYNTRIRAGINVVGISDFRTFLKNTEDYRRDLRRAEYGDERDPAMAAFMSRIAPLTNAHKITRPLFVAQGKNDPRVPWSEAEQIVKAVRGNGGVVWYLLFDDEGHGFRKKANVDYFNAASIQFWQQHLIEQP